MSHVFASWLSRLASGLDFLGTLLLNLWGLIGEVGEGGARDNGENPPESKWDPEIEEEGDSGEEDLKAFGDVGLWSEVGEEVMLVVNTGGGTNGARVRL